MTYVAIRCETPYAMSVADSCHTNKKPQPHCGIVLLIHRLTTTQVVTSVSSQTHGIAHLNALPTQKSDHLQVPCQAVDPNYLQTDWTTDFDASQKGKSQLHTSTIIVCSDYYIKVSHQIV